MTEDLYRQLSRLERRIMDAVYRLGSVPVADIVKALGEDDAYDSVRVTMANLERKGFLTHERDGRRNIYEPTMPEQEARKSAMDNVLRTFFDQSPTRAILGLLDRADTELSEEDIAEIRARIEAAGKSSDD